MSEMNIGGVILAGGESRRMGRNKALLRLGGEPLLAHVIRAVSSVADSVMLVTNSPQTFAPFRLKMVSDICPGFGALGGIHTALKESVTSHVLVVACDMPLLSRHVLERMIQLATKHDVVVPHNGVHYEPLCAVYSQQCVPVIERTMDEGHRRIDRIYEHLDVHLFGTADWQDLNLQESPFFNVNTPEDYQRLQQIMEGVVQ